MNSHWGKIKRIKKIVIKIGSSSLIKKDTGKIDLKRIEELVSVICYLKNYGKKIILVSSGAIAIGREALKIITKPKTMAEKQACAAIGQCALMAQYQNFFLYHKRMAAQVLMCKMNLENETAYKNLENVFEELLNLDVVPIVNENDATSTCEIEFGDNDTLSAIVSAIAKFELLIILSDVDGFYTDNPYKNLQAKKIEIVEDDRKDMYKMANSESKSDVGTGGMFTKVLAADIVNGIGKYMIIASGEDVGILKKIISGEKCGTLFIPRAEINCNLRKYLLKKINR
ncbi:MAG: glutamate 5-kinase [Clostridiales bacterium]|nr:glutamate 5-kinase [Clostridiales bacterium]